MQRQESYGEEATKYQLPVAGLTGSNVGLNCGRTNAENTKASRRNPIETLERKPSSSQTTTTFSTAETILLTSTGSSPILCNHAMQSSGGVRDRGITAGRNSNGEGERRGTGSVIKPYVDFLNLFDYMKQLKTEIWYSLFRDDAAFLAIFRFLSETEKVITIRLLYVRQAVSERAMRLWMDVGATITLRKALKNLVAFKILVAEEKQFNNCVTNVSQRSTNENDFHGKNKQLNASRRLDTTQYTLAMPFQETLQKLIKNFDVISCPLLSSSTGFTNEELTSEVLPTREEIENHSRKKWTNLQRWIVSGDKKESIINNLSDKINAMNDSPNAFSGFINPDEELPERPCDDVVNVLYRRNLVEYEDNEKRYSSMMSREAFSWLLKDLRGQVMSIVVEFLFSIDNGLLTNAAEDANVRVAEIRRRHAKEKHLHQITTNQSDSIACTDNYVGEKGSFPDQYTINKTVPRHTVTDLSDNNNSNKLSDIYISSLEATDKATNDMTHLLLMILSLSQSTIGMPFKVSSLNNVQRRFLLFIEDLGLVWMNKKEINPIYYFIAPYFLALNSEICRTYHFDTIISGVGDRTLEEHRNNSIWNDFNQHYDINTNNLVEMIDNETNGRLLCTIEECYYHPYLLSLTKAKKFISNMESEYTKGEVHNKLDAFQTIKMEAACSNDGKLIQDKEKHDGKDVNLPDSRITRVLCEESTTAMKPLATVHSLETGIVVQSNFKVYAYTASTLQICILSHLCDLQSRTPNLVVGIITRESILNAYKIGITAEEIIRFLQSHAHPVLLERYLNKSKDTSIVPPNVVSQLHMWEQERRRLTLDRVILYKKWDIQYMPELFQRSVRWAVSKNYAVYYSPFPENLNNKNVLTEWLNLGEKYLAVLAEFKDEMTVKIREIRENIKQNESRHA